MRPHHLAVFLVPLFVPAAYAAESPARPVRLIVPFSAGSASDVLARLIGPKLSENRGQQVVVDNRPSAGGTVAGGIVASSSPDGHTLLVTSSAFAGAAALYDKLPYDPVRDFRGVTLLVLTPLVMIVSQNGGIKSVKELLALAQQKPGQITFGSSGIASGTHYAGELFKLTARLDTVHVPYRGVPEAITDIISGRIHYGLMPTLAAMPHVRSGRALALGVTFRQRLAILPDVPTIEEAGVPGFVYEGWFGVLVPARTPAAIVNGLSKEIGAIITLPENRERIAHEGSTAKSSTPAEFEKIVHDEIVTRAKVFKAAGTKVN